MSKVDTLISELQAIAANPKKAMEDYKAETGKGAVGMVPVYTPEQAVYLSDAGADRSKYQRLVHIFPHSLAQ